MNSDLELTCSGSFGLAYETAVVIGDDAVVQTWTTSDDLRGIRGCRYPQGEWASCFRFRKKEKNILKCVILDGVIKNGSISL